MKRRSRHPLSFIIVHAAVLAVAQIGCGGDGESAQAGAATQPGTARVINLGQWWVTLFAGGVGGNLTVTDGTTTLSGLDTINFGYGTLGQVGALHSTGAFRPLKRGWAHNIYSIGFGGAQLSSASVRLSENDLLITTDVGTTYRIPPARGGTVRVSGAMICLVTSNSATLAQCALVNTGCVAIPVGPDFQGIGAATASYGVKGQAGVDSLVVYAGGTVEAHNDNLHDANADDVYVRIARPPSEYVFRME